jgi:hypothetical protein
MMDFIPVTSGENGGIIMKEKWTRRITWLLWLMAAHSFIVALGLIFAPEAWIAQFGFINYTDCFFRSQAGVFHLVMALAYLNAAADPLKNQLLVTFSIQVKTIALIFLAIYSFLEPAWVLPLSGLGDGLMALLLYLFNRQLMKHP